MNMMKCVNFLYLVGYGLSPQGSSFIPIGCISSPGSINNPSPTARSGYGHVVRSSMSPAGSSLSPQLESVGFGLGNSKYLAYRVKYG